jgi:hypothetical protein
LSLMRELKQILIPFLEHRLPGSRCLRTQPSSSELGLMVDPRGSLPHGVEPIFEGETVIASPHDKFTHDIIGLGIPWFEPFRVVENEEVIFG